jgi:hypothetical protein
MWLKLIHCDLHEVLGMLFEDLVIYQKYLLSLIEMIAFSYAVFLVFKTSLSYNLTSYDASLNDHKFSLY